MKRILSLGLALALISVLAVPVSAADVSGWKEVLEYVSLSDDGSNVFTITGQSDTLEIPLDSKQRLRKIDLLIWNPTGQRFTGASVTVDTVGTNTLEVLAIGSNLCRIVGYLPNAWYSSICVDLQKSSTGSTMYELLSCKVTPLGVQEFVCDASVYLGSTGKSYAISQHIDVPGDSDNDNPTIEQVRIAVNDWEKYDSLTIWGSTLNMYISSIRATIDTLGLPFTVSYMDSVNYGYWLQYSGTEYGYNEPFQDGYDYESNSMFQGWLTSETGGKFLFCITIDLTGVDRSLTTSPLYVYMTGLYTGNWGYSFNCQYVNGSVFTADTTNVSWWQRFTGFMSDLFGADKGEEALEDLGQSSDSISQGASDIQAFEQSQQAVLDTGMATIQNAVSYTSFMAALVFVQKYANMTFDGISKYAIVFTLPLFLGLFFYLCSRIPGVTRWKTRPPKSGGDSP